MIRLNNSVGGTMWSIAPHIAHMWHIPRHMLPSELHRYTDTRSNKKPRHTDHTYMMRDRLLPDQIHNYAHNNK